MRLLLLLGFAICIFLVGSSASAQKQDTDASQCNTHEKTSEGWERYYLAGPGGDAICVYLPRKPERLAGGKLRGGKTPVTADVYLTGGNDEIYAVIFLYDLPIKTEDMPDDQKAEIFFGTWRGTVEHQRQVLEKMTGRPVEIQFAQQQKLTVMGHDARVQLFKIASGLGQARIVFVGKKAYMLLGVWPPDRAERRSASFFDRFEMRVKQQVLTSAPPNRDMSTLAALAHPGLPYVAAPRLLAANISIERCS